MKTTKAISLLTLALSLLASTTTVPVRAAEDAARDAKLGEELGLSNIPFKIVYETFRGPETDGSWELCLVNADGSNPVLLTNTPDVSELYPHVSPDGRRLCFVADEVVNGTKTRNVYYMNVDGTDRVQVVENGRQPCWSPDGTAIAYMKGEFARYTQTDYASKGLFFYNIETGTTSQHVNKDLHHLYNICWSADGNWFLATVHGGMGYGHALLAFESSGRQVFNLAPANGCRSDLSPDQKRVTWLRTDTEHGVCDIRFDGGKPAVSDVRTLTQCDKAFEIYHPDWSPDGKWVAVSYGPRGGEAVGQRARGWNICVVEVATGRWAPITTDGKDNKEPDWVPLNKEG